MFLIHHSKVIVPENRQRREFDEAGIRDLARDLCKPHGQLHAIVLRGDGVTLVAGERRLRAIAYAETQGWRIPGNQGGASESPGPGYLYAKTLADLAPDELEEAELSENVCRIDLTWQEVVNARARLIDLRKKQDPEGYVETVSKEIWPDTKKANATRLEDTTLLAANMHRPEVAAAPSAKAARKVLITELDQEFRAELAKRQEGIPLDSRHTLIKGNVLHEMGKLAAGTVDCIIADPPYGINADTAFGDMADLDHEYADSPAAAANIYGTLAVEGFRVTKASAHAYIFLDHTWWPSVTQLFIAAGWEVWPRPLVWYKKTGMLPHPHHGPRYTYEILMFANKGHRPVNGVYPDVIECANIKHKQHAAQKPVALYANLIQRTCVPGDVVLDPCCGSGTIFPAATQESVQAIGIELSDKYHALALSRIKEAPSTESLANI